MKMVPCCWLLKSWPVGRGVNTFPPTLCGGEKKWWVENPDQEKGRGTNSPNSPAISGARPPLAGTSKWGGTFPWFCNKGGPKSPPPFGGVWIKGTVGPVAGFPGPGVGALAAVWTVPGPWFPPHRGGLKSLFGVPNSSAFLEKKNCFKTSIQLNLHRS